MDTQPPLKTPDFTPEAIVALVLGVVSNAIVLFELDVSDARKGAISGLITTGVLVAFLFHSAIIRKGRATGTTLRDQGAVDSYGPHGRTPPSSPASGFSPFSRGRRSFRGPEKKDGVQYCLDKREKGERVGELERIEPEGIVAAIRISPDEARDMQQRVNEIISGVLKPGKDYMKIPGTPKPSLLKPGAEALQRFFGLGSQSQCETGNLESGEFYAKATAQITNASGLVLSEATGWCDNSEKGKSGPKWRGDRNTIIQMAGKRAYVAAIKTATATSDHFTQDVEDKAPPPERMIPSTSDQRLLLAELFAKMKPCTQREAEEWVRSQPYAMQERWVAKQVLVLMLRTDPSSGSQEGAAAAQSHATAAHGEAQGESPSASPASPPTPIGPGGELSPDPVGEEEECDDVPF